MLSKDTVEHVSKLARLKLTEEELRAFSEQLSAVIENFEQISQVDTGGVLPLVTPAEMTVTLRPDRITENQESEGLFENAPEKAGRLYKVPPVV